MAWEAGRPDDVLARILDPVGVDDFFAENWGKSPLVIDGEADKFAGLMTWSDIDRIVESDQLSTPELVLNHRNEFVSRSRFLRIDEQGVEDGINGAGVQSCLASGATMIANGVDRLVPAISEMTSALEGTFGAEVHANMYLAFGEDNGFPVHRDLQDVIIVQVEGRKRWVVYQPTRQHPRKGDKGKAPDKDPYWEGVLEQGQALYMPRGWWHVARGLDEPSMHVTLGVIPPSGDDFLRWLVELRADDDAAVRANLPVLGRPLASASPDISSVVLGDEDGALMQEFLEYWHSQVRARTRLGLAQGWRPQATELHSESRLRLALTRGFGRMHIDDDTIHIRSGSHSSTVSVALWPALAKVRGTELVTMAELLDAVPAESQRQLQMLLTALVMKGVIASL